MISRTGACVKIIGLTESMRYLNISLFQGSLTEDKRQASLTLEMKGASNPALEHHHLGRTQNKNIFTNFLLPDPTIFATAYKKSRFYCFSSREVDTEVMDRDVFNEKPTKEETMAAEQVYTSHFVYLIITISRLLKPVDWLLKFVFVHLKAMSISSFSKIKCRKLSRTLLFTLEMDITMVISSIESSKVSWYRPDVHMEQELAESQFGEENSKMKLYPI